MSQKTVTRMSELSGDEKMSTIYWAVWIVYRIVADGQTGRHLSANS